MCENCQQLQARVAELEKALRELLNHSRGGGQDIVRTMARREAIRDAEAALTADPSPVVEVVRAAVEWAQHRTDSDRDYGEILEDAVYNLAPEWKQ